MEFKLLIDQWLIVMSKYVSTSEEISFSCHTMTLGLIKEVHKKLKMWDV